MSPIKWKVLLERKPQTRRPRPRLERILSRRIWKCAWPDSWICSGSESQMDPESITGPPRASLVTQWAPLSCSGGHRRCVVWVAMALFRYGAGAALEELQAPIRRFVRTWQDGFTQPASPTSGDFREPFIRYWAGICYLEEVKWSGRIARAPRAEYVRWFRTPPNSQPQAENPLALRSDVVLEQVWYGGGGRPASNQVLQTPCKA